MEPRLEHLIKYNLSAMKKTNILYTLLTFMLVVSMASCRKDPKVGGTAVQSLAGEWWVKLDGGTGEFGNSYYNLSTYNTAANVANKMWIDDMNDAKSFWDVKGVVNVNGQAFSGTNIANEDYVSQFTIANGKVLTGAAKASGTHDKTDSIYFEISFSDETPTVVHKVGGYKRTGFAQDDH